MTNIEKINRNRKVRRTALWLSMALAAAGSCNVAAQSSFATDYKVYPEVETLNLNGEWLFKWAQDGKAADAYRWFFEPDFDTSEFDTIPVPSNWTTHGFEEPHYVDGTEAEGFYVRRFEVPAEAAEMHALLHFGGVWASAEVWINGYNLGRHDSGFTPFGFEVKDHLKPGEVNTLSVRVRQRFGGNLFKYDANDDWGLPGIYRDVWLEFRPPNLFIESVEILTEFDEFYEDAEVKLRVHAFRHERDHFRMPSPPFQLRASVRTREGEEVASTIETFTINGGHMGRDVRFSVPVESPLHWNAETPNLYILQIDMMRGEGEVVHSWQDTFGFRQLSWDGGVFRINGQAVKLRGVNRHDQHPEVGRATTEEHWREDLLLMKEANINAVRMAHYPHAEGFVRLCDEIGMYLLNEIPSGFGGDRFRKPIFAGGMMLRIYSTVERDRNRPSVVVWCFGNEDPLTSMHVSGIRALKGMDPSRPILVPFRAEFETPPEVDILAPHYWFTEEYDQLGATSGRPIMSTEYTHALGRNQDFGELEQRWNALTQHPTGAGAFIWLWADQGLLRNTEGKEVLHPMEDKSRYTRTGSEFVADKIAGPNAIYDSHGHNGTDGIVDADREPQSDFWETKAVYAPVRLMVERLPIVAGQTEVRIPVRNGYDFLNLTNVSFEWELMRNDSVITNGTEKLDAVPHTTRDLVIRTGALVDVGDGAVYVIHVSIRRPDGSIMNEQSVRLGYGSTDYAIGPFAAQSLRGHDQEGKYSVTAGDIKYEFDKASGELVRVMQAGKVLAEGMDVVVWRPSTDSERNRYDRRPNQHDWNSYMQGLSPKLLDWQVEESRESITVRVKSEYRLDELNAFTASMVYQFGADGMVQVNLEVRPEMDVPELPEIGIELVLASAATHLTWLGEGPGESLPGRSTANRFGWWSTETAGRFGSGTKSFLEWGRVDLEGGSGLYLHGLQGLRLEQKNNAPDRLRILTHIGGAWSKNGPPERRDWHLSLVDEDTGFGPRVEKREVFSGSFELRPIVY